jgi:glutamyl-tRNA synthetase
VSAALLAWLSAKSRGGEIVLRIEDLDPARSRREYAEAIMDDLKWLGLSWDRRAEDQSRRGAAYREALARLDTYPCYCSRKELLAASAPHASDGFRVYSGRCRTLTQTEKNALAEGGRRPAWRIAVPAETIEFVDGNFGPQSEVLDRDRGDFILRRSDGVYAYQLAVTADDGAMGVNRVVRGWDLLSSTPRQIWLMEKLGYEVPTYCHAPLLCSPDGRRLSKRDRDLDMGVLRQRYTPEELVGYLACTAGIIDRPESVKPYDLVKEFSWEKVGTRDREPIIQL